MHYFLQNPGCSTTGIRKVFRWMYLKQAPPARPRRNQTAHKVMFLRLCYLQTLHTPWKTVEESVGKQKKKD